MTGQTAKPKQQNNVSDKLGRESSLALSSVGNEGEACYRFIDALKLVRRATNLFDNKTLAIHPYSTIFGNFSAQERAAMDVLPTAIRVGVGAGGYGGYYQGL